MEAISRASAGFLGLASSSHARAAFWLAAICLILFLPGFFSIQPMDRDEPRFAQATKQMLESGDFVDIRFQHEARHKKPVGIYWAQSAAVAAGAALGVDDARRTIWLYRLPSLVGAVAAVLFVYWAFLVMADRRVAFAAALVFAASILLGVEARLAKTDALMCATAALAMGVLARAWMLRMTSGPTRGEAILFWAALAGSFLLKGPVVMMIVGLAALALAARERSAAWLLPLGWWPAIGIALAIVAPWFVMIAVKSGGGFFAESLGKDMLGKVGQGRESHWGPPGAYLLATVATFWPGSALVLLALPSAWRDRRDDGTAFCLAWVIPSWIVFELVPTKLPHYVLPLLPALALLAVRLFAVGPQPILRGWRAPASLVLTAIPVFVAAALIAGTLMLEGVALTSIVPLALALPLVLLAIVTSVIAWRLLSRGEGLSVVPVAALAAALLSWGVYAAAWSGLRGIQISPRLAEAARAANCPETRLASAGYHEPSLVFLTRTDILFTDGPGAAKFLAEGDCRIAFVTSRVERPFTEAIEASGVGARLAGRQRGFNINGGRRVDIGVYVRDRGR